MKRPASGAALRPLSIVGGSPVAPEGDLEGSPVEQSLQDQLSSVRGLLAISLLMLRRTREADVLHLAATAVPSLVAGRVLGIHLDGVGWRETGPLSTGELADVTAALADCGLEGGPLPVTDARRARLWAFPLTSFERPMGQLVISAEVELQAADLVLLRALAQQAGVAIANARLHASTQETNAELARTVEALQRKTAIHDRFTQVAVSSGGPDGIVRALHELTGLAAGIEDRQGAVLAWAGAASPPQAQPEPAGEASDGVGRTAYRDTLAERHRFVDQVCRAGRPLRVAGRLVTVARPRADVVGVIFLEDRDGVAGEQEIVALEHAATVLSIELARLLSVAESELRLGVDVLSELVTGHDPRAASRRAQALGHDLFLPHRVLVIEGHRPRGEPEALLSAVRDVLSGGRQPLLQQRGDLVVALVPVENEQDRSVWTRWAEVLRASSVGRGARIGVGGLSHGPEDVQRSYQEAVLALRIPSSGALDQPCVVHDDLGVYQLLAEVPDSTRVDRFVRTWLGVLLDYDERKGSDLVLTLARYLDNGGNYDATGASLAIGRSTVRYRLRRIKELSGFDLADPETRFQIQLAARAWFTRRAMANG